MVRRWCLPVAAFALACGVVSGAGLPASAASVAGQQAIQPGGVARQVGPVFSSHGLRYGTSTNWSGYASDGGPGQDTDVSASWTEPTGHCSSGDQYSAFWVGLDGWKSNSVEQTGTEVDCSGGQPSYSAWWEMYPGASHNFSNTVEPGDQFWASVTTDQYGDFTLYIQDSTRGWSHTMYETLTSAQISSAEIIVEAPCCTQSGGILPLADFGTVHFSEAEINGAPLSEDGATRIIMESGGTQKDSVTSISDGGSFSATWLHR